jgi:hypothetical protein
VFVSSNSTFGVGDILIASNSVTLSSSSTLAAGASSSPTYSGVWPTAGLYYIYVVVQAADATPTSSVTPFGSVTLN